MGAGAIGFAFDQRGAVAGSRPLHRLPRHSPDGGDIVAVHLDAGHAVGCAALGDAGVAGRVSERHFGGELVVLADEQHGQLPDAGHVQAFVKRAVVDGAIAEKRHRHARRLHQLEAVARARRLQNAGPHDAAGAHQADLRGKQVHTAAAAARASGFAAKEFGDQLHRRQTLG